jgi:hypothetical protein
MPGKEIIYIQFWWGNHMKIATLEAGKEMGR